jgi:hypothetical protein
VARRGVQLQADEGQLAAAVAVVRVPVDRGGEPPQR